MKKKLLALTIFIVAICVSISLGTGITSASAAEYANTESKSTSYFKTLTEA